MMPRVAKVAPLSQYRLHVEFDDGVAGTIDWPGPCLMVLRPLAGLGRKAPELFTQLLTA